MSKLLILPGNKAIRQNPDDPEAFPDADHQVLCPGVENALNFYKRQGFAIAVCENAGSVASGISTLHEKLTEFMILITQIAPQIDSLMFTTDYKGAFAYLLSKQNGVPSLRKLRSTQVSGYLDLSPPRDDGKLWEDVDVQPFRKPEPGMLDWMILDAKARQTVAVWEREEDMKAAQMTTFNQGDLRIQSSNLWLKALDPMVSDQQAQPNAQSTGTASQERTFYFVDPSVNANKFWKIRKVDSLSFDISYGRIGTNGRTIQKTFTNAAHAATDYQKRISDQLDQGYIEQ